MLHDLDRLFGADESREHDRRRIVVDARIEEVAATNSDAGNVIGESVDLLPSLHHAPLADPVLSNVKSQTSRQRAISGSLPPLVEDGRVVVLFHEVVTNAANPMETVATGSVFPAQPLPDPAPPKVDTWALGNALHMLLSTAVSRRRGLLGDSDTNHPHR